MWDMRILWECGNIILILNILAFRINVHYFPHKCILQCPVNSGGFTIGLLGLKP